ncbi:family 10 glycosylhydrolase, partial [Thermodesulfobacteriota bacterium]
MISKRVFLFFIIIFSLSITSCKKEERAVWVVRFDLQTEDNVKKIVKNTKAAGFDTIIAQVYGRGDAYYDSYIAPRTETLEDQPEDYDPLKTIIEESKKNGLKVHA